MKHPAFVKENRTIFPQGNDFSLEIKKKRCNLAGMYSSVFNKYCAFRLTDMAAFAGFIELKKKMFLWKTEKDTISLSYLVR